MTENALARLEEVLGYRFRDPGLLTQALTHSSRKNDLFCSNERLEFLGDAILGEAISVHLYRHFPDYAEGDLTRVKSVVVSRVSLARVAKEMDLGAYLIVAKGVAVPSAEQASGEEPSGEPGKARLPPSLLANAFEALVAAIFLDGGAEAAHGFIMRHTGALVARACNIVPEHNFKSALQEQVQRSMGLTPVYEVASETGPDHVKLFEVVTVIGGRQYGAGHGTTKKAAEQEAACRSLEMLKAKGDTGEAAET